MRIFLYFLSCVHNNGIPACANLSNFFQGANRGIHLNFYESKNIIFIPWINCFLVFFSLFIHALWKMMFCLGSHNSKTDEITCNRFVAALCSIYIHPCPFLLGYPFIKISIQERQKDEYTDWFFLLKNK